MQGGFARYSSKGNRFRREIYSLPVWDGNICKG